jgi:hypothetical protein
MFVKALLLVSLLGFLINVAMNILEPSLENLSNSILFLAAALVLSFVDSVNSKGASDGEDSKKEPPLP